MILLFDVIAASLLAVGIITVLSMVEQGDAAKKNKIVIINRDSVISNADGADGFGPARIWRISYNRGNST